MLAAFVFHMGTTFSTRHVSGGKYRQAGLPGSRADPAVWRYRLAAFAARLASLFPR